MPSTRGNLDLFAERGAVGRLGGCAVCASGSCAGGAEGETGPVPSSRIVGACGEITGVPLEPEAAGADDGGCGRGADVVEPACEIRPEPGDVRWVDGGDVARPWESGIGPAVVSGVCDITVLRGSNPPVTSDTKSRDIAFVGASSSSWAVLMRTVSCPASTATSNPPS